jgi:hypothetical protein
VSTETPDNASFSLPRFLQKVTGSEKMKMVLRLQTERSRTYALGAQGVGGSAGSHRPFGGAPAPPQPRVRESNGDAPT